MRTVFPNRQKPNRQTQAYEIKRTVRLVYFAYLCKEWGSITYERYSSMVPNIVTSSVISVSFF